MSTPKVSAKARKRVDQMAIVPSAENVRSEMARHRLSREAVCDPIGMHRNQFSMFANGVRPMTGWAAHNIGWSINQTTGMKIFDVDMDQGPVRAPRGRPHRRAWDRPQKIRRHLFVNW